LYGVVSFERDMYRCNVTLVMVEPAGMLDAMSNLMTARRLKPSRVRPVKQ
jgi:hypothetical protein